MKRSTLHLCIATTLFLLAACSPAAEPESAAPTIESTPAADSASDPLTGTWSGDWGPSANDRNPVTLELRLDGSNLTGTVNPGPNAVQLSSAAFNRDTGAIMMEADAQGRGGATFHYTIEGTVQGNMMSGSWGHDDVQGDFKLTKN
jgi:hypothetical protein